MFGQAAKRQFNGFDSQSSSSGGFGTQSLSGGVGTASGATPFGTSSQNQPNPTQQPGFGQSTFGTSTINGNSSFGSLGNASLNQSQSSFFNSDVLSSPVPNNNNISNSNTVGPGPSYSLSHSQSAYDLRGAANGNGQGLGNGSMREHSAPLTPGFRSSRGAPSWTSNDRRFVPSHLSAIKQKSSFYAGDRTPERSASFTRRASTSPTMKSSLAKGGESPPSGVGGSSFGTPKPSGTKKQTHTITEEELPPTQSIYDSRGSPFSAARRGNSAGSGMRRSETFSSNININNHSSNHHTSARKTLRATASFNHASSNTPRKMALGNDGNLSVVVYGFPQHLTPSIVSHFSNFGEILENVEPSDASFGLSTTPVKRPPPGNRPPVFAGRNWIKISYDNKASVIRALAEDGSQFAGQYVIGCKPYTPSQMRDFDAISASMLDSHVMDVDMQESPVKPKAQQQQQQSVNPNRTLPRTTSLPALNGAKRLEIRDGTNTVFKQPSTKTITNPKVKKTGFAEKTGWLSWTAKRAEELIFGYEV